MWAVTDELTSLKRHPLTGKLAFVQSQPSLLLISMTIGGFRRHVCHRQQDVMPSFSRPARLLRSSSDSIHSIRLIIALRPLFREMDASHIETANVHYDRQPHGQERRAGRDIGFGVYPTQRNFASPETIVHAFAEPHKQAGKGNRSIHDSGSMPDDRWPLRSGWRCRTTS